MSKNASHHPLLKHPFFASHPDVIIETIEQGLSHHCVKVTVASKAYFVKQYSDRSPKQLAREHFYQKHASDHGLAPKPVYADQHVIISEFIDGITLAKSGLAIEDKVSLALDSIRRFSRLSCDNTAILNVSNVISELLARHQALPLTQQQLLLNAVENDINEISKLASDKVLVHGDLNFTNILVGESANYLVDYEHTVVADIEYEVAMMLAINGLTISHSLSFWLEVISAYFARYSLEISDIMVTRYLDLCCIINALWFYGADVDIARSRPRNETRDQVRQVTSSYYRRLLSHLI
ncbi:phosphotransferase [Thalassotalea ganghwensis]